MQLEILIVLFKFSLAVHMQFAGLRVRVNQAKMSRVGQPPKSLARQAVTVLEKGLRNRSNLIRSEWGFCINQLIFSFIARS